MTEPFRLTMWEPRERRYPYERSTDGATWSGISADLFTHLVKSIAIYPDDARREVAAGGVVALRRWTAGDPLVLACYVRRTPTRQAAADAARQTGLFEPVTLKEKGNNG